MGLGEMMACQIRRLNAIQDAKHIIGRCRDSCDAYLFF